MFSCLILIIIPAIIMAVVAVGVLGVLGVAGVFHRFLSRREAFFIHSFFSTWLDSVSPVSCCLSPRLLVLLLPLPLFVVAMQ